MAPCLPRVCTSGTTAQLVSDQLQLFKSKFKSFCGAFETADGWRQVAVVTSAIFRVKQATKRALSAQQQEVMSEYQLDHGSNTEMIRLFY